MSYCQFFGYTSNRSSGYSCMVMQLFSLFLSMHTQPSIILHYQTCIFLDLLMIGRPRQLIYNLCILIVYIHNTVTSKCYRTTVIKIDPPKAKRWPGVKFTRKWCRKTLVLACVKFKPASITSMDKGRLALHKDVPRGQV